MILYDTAIIYDQGSFNYEGIGPGGTARNIHEDSEVAYRARIARENDELLLLIA